MDRVNVTRLKDILAAVPGLCEQTKGKYVLLTLDGAMVKLYLKHQVLSFVKLPK